MLNPPDCASILPVASTRTQRPEPVSPLSPLAPLVPFVPLVPSAPLAPSAPFAPAGPVGPTVPGAPGVPAGPCAPVDPLDPFGSWPFLKSELLSERFLTSALVTVLFLMSLPVILTAAYDVPPSEMVIAVMATAIEGLGLRSFMCTFLQLLA